MRVGGSILEKRPMASRHEPLDSGVPEILLSICLRAVAPSSEECKEDGIIAVCNRFSPDHLKYWMFR